MNAVGLLHTLHRVCGGLQVQTLRACDAQMMVVAIAERMALVNKRRTAYITLTLKPIVICPTVLSYDLLDFTREVELSREEWLMRSPG